MKKLFIFILSFPLLTSFGQSTNSFCAFNQNGEKYELNLVDGTGSLTFVQYNRSGVIVKTVSGTWSMRDEGVYGPFERLTVNIPVGQMKFLVVRTSRGAIQELQDESAYKRNFQPCTGIFSGGNNQTQKIIQYNPNASRIIGTPIRIGNLMIASKDMPEPLDWWDAKEECLKLGDDWRLPTKEELDLIYENKSRIGIFRNGGYWSISQSANRMTNNGELILAWSKNFNTGIKTDYEKKYPAYVRAVKTAAAISEVKEPIKEPIKETIKLPTGKPYQRGNLEVAQYNFAQKMTWEDAKKACEALGEGWRLPTIDELTILSKYKNGIGPYADGLYWSSKDFSADNAYSILFPWGVEYNNTQKNSINYVRAVRSLNPVKLEIYGTPIKIGNFEVAQFYKELTWDETKSACAKLGDGWRLPTKDELNFLYLNKPINSSFPRNYYWSSTEDGASKAWCQGFSRGDQGSSNKSTILFYFCAIRSF